MRVRVWFRVRVRVRGGCLVILRFFVKALEVLSEPTKLDYRYTYANLNGMTVARIAVRVGATGVSIKYISNEL